MSTSVFTQYNTLEKVSGIVKRITFHSVETGWTVLKMSPFDRPLEEVAVTVHQSKVFAGATMEFYGNWTHHPKFGEQFKAVRAIEKKPATTNALQKYLGSGLMKGVGPATAKAIVAYFGKETLEVFDTQIERLDEALSLIRVSAVRNCQFTAPTREGGLVEDQENSRSVGRWRWPSKCSLTRAIPFQKFAQLLGSSRATLYRYFKKAGLATSLSDFRSRNSKVYIQPEHMLLQTWQVHSVRSAVIGSSLEARTAG